MSLTMEEFLAKREELEDDIRGLLVQFETETGITPKEIRLELMRASLVGKRRPVYRIMDVQVEVNT